MVVVSSSTGPAGGVEVGLSHGCGVLPMAVVTFSEAMLEISVYWRASIVEELIVLVDGHAPVVGGQQLLIQQSSVYFHHIDFPNQ